MNSNTNSATHISHVTLPQHSYPSSDARREAELRRAEANWENEGGDCSGFNGRSNYMAAPSRGTRELESQAERVTAMMAALSSDYANGRVGLRHNTFEHRSRVLRQEHAKLEAMRERHTLHERER
jgi:hypothetical protein